MKRFAIVAPVTFAVAMSAVLVVAAKGSVPAGARGRGDLTAPVDAPDPSGWGELPLLLIENRGQVDDVVDYVVPGAGTTAYLTGSGMRLALNRYMGTELLAKARMVLVEDELDDSRKEVIGELVATG